MKTIVISTLVVFSTLFITSCSSDDEGGVDETKPEITLNYEDGFPQPCTQLQRGESYTFRAKVSDNVALASYSLNIHDNFDHHTHDDQEVDCPLNPIQEALSPFIFMQNYSIEGGLAEYEIMIILSIPNDADTGDYHCAFSVTDTTGWQSRTSVDIKIVE